MIEIRFIDRIIRIEGVPGNFRDRLEFIFGPLLTGPVPEIGKNKQTVCHIRMAIMSEGEIQLTADKTAIFADPDEAFLALVSSINGMLLTGEGDFLRIHAGAVKDSASGAAVIAGLSDSGKSTLALYLAKKGLELLSDEGIYFLPENGRFIPYPRAASRLPGGFASRSRMFEEMRIGNLVSYFRPLDWKPSNFLRFYQIKEVIFLNKGKKSYFTQIEREDALIELVPHVLGISPGRKMSSLLEFLAQASLFYRFTWRNLEDLFRIADQLW